MMTQTVQTSTLGNGVHALAAGSGTPVVLLPGWPETAEAYSEVLPALAERHHVLAIDPPGLGESSESTGGYDTGSISKQLEDALRSFTPEPIHLVSHDVGAWIAYAWAAQFSRTYPQPDPARFRTPRFGSTLELSSPT